METPIPTALRPQAKPSYQFHGGSSAVSEVIHDDSATMERLVVTNATGNAGFVQVHDADELPDNSAVPLLSFPIAANGIVSLDGPVYCSTGLVVAISTTLATLTISTNAALVFSRFQKN